jgi:uncharacterized protein with NRDE domain
MCLIAMAWGLSPQFPLVIAANRDEWYARPTAPIDSWVTASGHTVVGGRDLQDGGTWMGFTPQGRFAMLTNVRNPSAAPPATPISRGHLVIDWLCSAMNADEWAGQCEAARYAGFNLLVGDWAAQTCHYITNQYLPNQPAAQVFTAQPATKYVAPRPLALSAGSMYTLSNAALDTPWPKSLKLGHAVQQAIASCRPVSSHPAPDSVQNDVLVAALQRALQDPTRAALQSIPHTGVPTQLEQALSSVFVQHPAHGSLYGTRTSLCALVGHDGRLQLTETTHQPSPHQATRLLDWSHFAPG